MSRAVTIGIFDGVHLGHRALLDAARATGLSVTALTFDPHPAALLAPSRVPPMLLSLDDRESLLREGGADSVVVLPFDRTLAAQTPAAFVEEILLGQLGAACVVVGDDFRYGCDRRGDIAALRLAGERRGFSVVVVPPVFLGGVPARSTTIRQMLAGGQPEGAARLLGRPHFLTGIIVRGKQLGRTIGFPTANLDVPRGLLVPAPGVYAGEARWNGLARKAAISVGVNVTVDESAAPTVEAYLLDFDGDLYDETLTLTFERFLRPMVKFNGLDALIAAIRADVEAVR